MHKFVRYQHQFLTILVNKNILIVLLFALSGLLIVSCAKKEPYVPPKIEILLPAANDLLQLPGYAEINVQIESEQNIDYVRISIDNEQLTPLFTPKFFYPETNHVEINYDLPLDYLPQGQTAPFYLHVVVYDGIETNHAYQKVRLNSTDYSYQGFYLFSQQLQSRISIDFYDDQYQIMNFSTLDGSYIDSDASAQHDMLFVIADKPDNLYAFEFDDQQLKWTQQPLNPYPYFTDIFHSGNRLFTGTGNGQVSGRSDATGYVKVITPVLTDSMPNRIGVNDDFFIADFLARNDPSGSWVVFYNITGQVFQRYPSDIRVVDFYPLNNPSGFSIIGNRMGKGIYADYLISINSTSEVYVFEDGLISHSCFIDANEYVVSIDKRMYRFNSLNKTNVLLYEFDSNIVGLEYDTLNQVLFVALEQNIEIFSYPNGTRVKTIDSEHPVKGLKLRFGY